MSPPGVDAALYQPRYSCHCEERVSRLCPWPMSRTSQIIQPEAALVLFSGGQDSTTCLAWALARFASVETIGFDYGQRHRVELDCRKRIAERLRREFPVWKNKLGPDHLIDLA